MAYREVTMVEVKEVLRLWLAGKDKKPIAAQLGMDPKTVRRYVAVAESCGLSRAEGPSALSDERLAAVLVALKTLPPRERGESWKGCEEQRVFIAEQLGRRVRLSKIRKLLARRGVEVPYPTLHRFAVAELGFGRSTPTIPVADGEPGGELQVDTAVMEPLDADLFGKRRRYRVWIFTAVRSRHRFVYPTFRERTEDAIEACEAAWRFFGGVFRVLLPDNTKAIVDGPDPLNPRLNRTFLEYAQSRGFEVDPARVRHPQDKGRVERAVTTVREDCFGGERLQTLEDARRHAQWWCQHDYGMKPHGTTGRRPLEHFEAEEQPRLLPLPAEPYDVPLWREPKVGRDQHAQVERALYSLPVRYVGQKLVARADRSTVRFYDGGQLVKTHPRQPPCGRSTDENDFDAHKSAYANRDVDFVLRQARQHGEAIGALASALLAGPLPWTRMRRAYALLGLVRRYGAERVEAAAARALAAEMLDVKRLARMLAQGSPPQPEPSAPSNVIPMARYLRSPKQYALPLRPTPEPGDKA